MREEKIPGPMCFACNTEIVVPADCEEFLYRQGIYVHIKCFAIYAVIQSIVRKLLGDESEGSGQS